MSDALGLSVGTTNLVAAPGNDPPLVRRSILTLFNDRGPEVGEYAGPNQPRLVLTGFVERVGDPVPLVASDGSSHRGEIVLVEALDGVARAVGGGTPVTIAVPAHWGPGRGRSPAQRFARQARSGARRRSTDPDPRFGSRAGRPARGARAAARRRRGVVRLRRKRHEHHAGRRRRGPGDHRRNGPLRSTSPVT